MNVSTDQPDADHPDLAGLIEQLNTKLEAGESVDLEHLLKEHPQHTEQIQSLLPAMTALMDLAIPAPQNNDPLALDLSNGTGELRRLGDFRIGREIGRGGMGVVYEAEQVSLGRRVALKVLPFAAVLDKKCLQRFKNEARAAATLDHPNIVSIHSVGCEQAVHFYSMRLIEGQSLAEAIAQLRSDRQNGDSNVSSGKEQQIALDGDTLPSGALSTHGSTSRRKFFHTAARLGIQVAEALQYAHEMGIVHRDIKPSNLLLDSSGNIWVADFGLAMIQTDADLTKSGDIVGTLRYMSPELAAGKRAIVNHLTDVYSLGATLYELLTLRPAYLAEDRQQLLQQIAFEEPTALRRIEGDIPAELETIVHKAMSKDMDHRYSSAQELADDLRSHLENRPIKARPPTLSQTIDKWTRRNPIVFSAAALIGVILLVATLVSSVLAIREYEARQRESIERKRAVRAEQQATAAAQRNRRLSYLSDVNLAHQIYKAGDLARATQLLMRYLPRDDKEDLRAFEWYYLWNVCGGDRSVRALPREGVVDVTFSPDGRTFATGGADGMIQIWDRNTLKKVGDAWPVDPDPHAQFRSIDVLYSPSGEILAGLFRTALEHASGRVLLFDVDTGDTWPLAHGSPNNVVRIAFKEQDNTLVTAERNGQVRFWNASTGQPLGKPRQLAKGATWRRAAFSSDLRLLAAGGPKGLPRQPGVPRLRDVQIKVYDIETGSIQAELETDESILGKLQFTEDSRFLINPGNPPYATGKLVIWEIETGKEVFSIPEIKCFVGVASISTDVVAVGGPDSISFVNPAKGGIVNRWEGVPGIVSDLAVSPDGKQLASTAWEGMVRFWDLPRQENPMTVELDTPSTKALSFSPTGDMLVSAHLGGVVLRNPLNFEEVHHLDGQTRPVFSPAGNRLATVSTNGSTIHFWDYRTGQPNSPPVPLEGHSIEQLAFSTNGKLIGCATKSGAVIILELATQRIRKQFDIPSAYHYLAFGVNRDGQDLIAIPASERTVKLVNLDEGLERILEGPMAKIVGVAFSSNGHRIASSGNDIFVWNTNTGEVELAIEECSGAIMQVAFSRDGGSILSRGWKGSLGLWDLQSGREKMRLLEEFKQTLQSATFSPDGNRIVAGVNNNALMVWSAPRVDSMAGTVAEIRSP